MRTRNEGSIYKITRRGKTRWRVAISLGNGRRSMRDFDTLAEARRHLTEANRRKEVGLPTVDSRTRLGTFLTRWLEEHVKPTTRPATFESYSAIVRNHLLPALGDTLVSRLTPAAVSSFLRGIADKGISAEHVRRVLRNALNYAVKHEVVSRNAASLATVPKREPKQPTFLSPTQARTFLGAVKGNRYEALFAVALSCGLRLSEALGLSWADIDFDEGKLSVNKQLRSVRGAGKAFSKPKSRRSVRTIPVPQFALEVLREHRLTQEFQDRLAAGARWQYSGLVFCSKLGTPCDERNIRRSLDRVVRAAGLPRLRFHDLRHSCATLLLAQGVDPRTIMEILGHSSITLTLQTYSHVLPQLTQDAADRMHQLLMGR